MIDVNNYIIEVGIINALLVLAIVIVFKNWPKRSARK